MRFLLLAIGAIALAGCNMAYQLPDHATQIARVRFTAPEASIGNSMSVYAMSDASSCMTAQKLRHLGGWQMGGMSASDVDLGMPRAGGRYEENTYVEIPVIAEQRFHFTLQGYAGGTKCSLTLSFLPKTGHQYEVGYSSKQGYCYGRVDELIVQGKTVRLQREPSTRRNEKDCGLFWN